MSSVLGTHGGRGSSVYAASKAGIIGKSHLTFHSVSPVKGRRS